MVYAGVYSVVVGSINISGSHELIEITAPTDQNVIILRAWLQPAINATTPDEAIDIAMGFPTVSGGGGAITPEKMNPNFATAKSSATGNSGTPPTMATPVIRQGFHMQQGFTYLPIPEERMVVPGGDLWGFAVLDNPISTYACTFGVVFAEV